MRVGVKVGYVGSAFHGFARQPDVRTVEGELAFALRRAGLVNGGDGDLRGASRTDAGVSAVGNVVAFDTAVPLDGITGRFNEFARDVWAWAVAEAPSGFRPSRARQRWYRYHLPEDHDAATLSSASQSFLGRHDFAAFAARDAPRTWRTVDSIRVTHDAGLVLVDVRAPSFLRGMVRRIVAALLAVETGEATVEELGAALDSGVGRDLGTVAPEPLVLMDVDVGIPFRGAIDGATRERIERQLSEARLVHEFWRQTLSEIERER